VVLAGSGSGGMFIASRRPIHGAKARTCGESWERRRKALRQLTLDFTLPVILILSYNRTCFGRLKP
jgi:hypothetical protein